MYLSQQNCPVELRFESRRNVNSSSLDVRLFAEVTDPDGETRRVPAYWAGGKQWVIRYASGKLGKHRFRTQCSDDSDDGLHNREGEIEITEYTGNNALIKHGGLRKHRSGAYLEHTDGTPFFWLADTWWMGLTKRLSASDFQELLRDRVEKGFTVVQIVAGLYPDMEPFDERGANEAGFPWDERFTAINPKYFDEADKKLNSLIEAGIVPCIVGSWGFFMQSAGYDVLKKHWDYLIARYAALPVVWCIAGEALMPFYTHPAIQDPALLKEYRTQIRKNWTDMTRYVHNQDPFARPVTIHPTDFGRDMVDDDSLLDFEMLQTGHSGFFSASGTMKMINKSVNRKPRMPVINSEVCYEGICGSSHHDVQRYMFWTCMLSGASGHTYGANGIWQVNAKEFPYGVSPHGASWGDTTWDEAYHFYGSKHVGIGKMLLTKYRWWTFEPHPEWVENHADQDQVMALYAAGIPNEVRIIFLPFAGECCWKKTIVKNIEPEVTYRAYFFDPLTGLEHDQGVVQADDDGNWSPGKFPAFQDWVLVLESKRALNLANI